MPLMSAVRPLPPPRPGAVDSLATEVPVAVGFHYIQTESFVALLHQLGASLLVSTYRASKLLVARAARGGLSPLVRTFDRPMGLAVSAPVERRELSGLLRPVDHRRLG